VPDRPGDMDERDVDARFASIVARWDGPVPDAQQVTAPAGVEDSERAEGAGGEQHGEGAAANTDEASTDEASTDTAENPDDAEAAERDAGEPAAPPVTPRSPWVNPSPLDVVVPPSAWRAAQEPDAETAAAAAAAEEALAEDEHFEPPEVVLPPQEDLHFWGAVIGLVAGPLMLLWVVFARPSHSVRWFLVSVLVSLVGFGLLVLRQPKHRDPTSGDNGARV
jgi:hypothetical protein